MMASAAAEREKRSRKVCSRAAGVKKERRRRLRDGDSRPRLSQREKQNTHHLVGGADNPGASFRRRGLTQLSRSCQRKDRTRTNPRRSRHRPERGGGCEKPLCLGPHHTRHKRGPLAFPSRGGMHPK